MNSSRFFRKSRQIFGTHFLSMNANTIRRFSCSTTLHRSLHKQIQKSIAMGSMNRTVSLIDSTISELQTGDKNPCQSQEGTESHELMELEMMMNELDMLKRGLTPSMHGRCVLGKIEQTTQGWNIQKKVQKKYRVIKPLQIIMADIKKTKPKFSDVESIRPGSHCYNVYVKVLECSKEKKTNNKNEEYSVATGLCGDKTACANFKFVGKWADLVKEGQVYAIRNGRSDLIDERIMLQLDNFGKLTEENKQVDNVNKNKNISADKWEKVSKNKKSEQII